MKRVKCLLIWPPFLTAHQLPLGIPFLTSYLKKSGFSDINVLDLNMAYLRKMRLFFFLYNLNKKYHSIIAKKAVPSKRKYRKPLWRKVAAYLPKYINKKMTYLLDFLSNKEKKSIPWSLKAILNADLDKDFEVFMKKTACILTPEIKSKEIDLVGISAIYPEQLFFAFIVAKVVKEVLGRKIPVVFGGTQITKHIDHLTKSPKIHNFVDFFITNDGEIPLAQLLEAIPEKNFSNIPNLYFKTQDKKTGYSNSQANFSLSPDSFPVPDFTGFELNNYRKQLPILVSKGCFWSRCTFCTYACMHEKQFKINTSKKSIDTIRKMVNTYGVMNYKFIDDALPFAFLRKLSDGLIQAKLNIRWDCSIVLSTAFKDLEFCRSLKESGLRHVSIGLESISTRILNLMNKNHKDLKKEVIKEILSTLKKAGINTGLHIIFGFPTETVDEARITLDFLIQNKDLYNACMFQPFCLEDNTPIFFDPGRFSITRIYKEDKASGGRLGYRYDISTGMSQKDAFKFTYREAFKTFKRSGIAIRSSGPKL